MALISRMLPGLIGGVSQQAPSLSLENQCEIQENASSSLVDGLIKRPPTEWVAALDTPITGQTHIHPINRDLNERYIVITNPDRDNPISVYTLDGEKCTVLYESEDLKKYIVEDDDGNLIQPRRDLRMTTAADHTIIVNTKRVAKMKDETEEVPSEGLIYVKRGVASTDYQVEIVAEGEDPIKASYKTGKQDEDPDSFRTNKIASELYNSLKNRMSDESWYINLLGSVIVIRRMDGKSFRIKTTDSYGDDALFGIKGSVQKFTDLPPEAEEGMVLGIAGDPDISFDGYYVKFMRDDDGSGVWRETVKKGLKNSFDPMTLPLRLIRSGHNEFTLKTIEWDDRQVGDDVTAPEPSFIGHTINDVFFFKNRLGFLSGENVILSRSGDFFNLWPATATDVLDSDPIDVAVTSNQVAILRHAVPFTGSLLLFSDQLQFLLSAGGNILTPRTVSIDRTTSFEASQVCRPVEVGPNVFFVTPNGDFSAVREYYVQPETHVNDAANVTAHVPRYVPSGVTEMAASSVESTLFLITSEEPKTVYVYKFHWEGEQKVQSSWSRWTFDDEIHNIAVIENYLFMVVSRDGQNHLVRMNLENVVSDGLDFRVHLDKQVKLTGVYDPETDSTTWTLPYQDSSTEFQAVDSSTGLPIPALTRPDSKTLRAPGDHSKSACYVGKRYVKRYRFLRWFLRDENGTAITQGRLQVRTLTLGYTNTGYFRVVLLSPGREMDFVHTGNVLGEMELGYPNIVTGEERFLVMANAKDTVIEIINDSYLPSQIHSAGYEGLWFNRNRILG